MKLPLDISSDPPVRPLAVSFGEGEAVTVPESAPAPSETPARPAPARVTPARRLLAFGADAALLALLLAAHAALALFAERYPLDALRSQASIFVALLAVLAVAYSWFFIALGARTPGMAVARLRLRTLQGSPPTPSGAFARALLTLPSAGLGLFGFVLALFDARGQTLHDKLCRCVAVID